MSILMALICFPRYNPTWMESKFILINALNESLVLNLWDYNDHRKNTQLGSATFELSKLLEDATQENIRSPLLKDGKERGELRYDLAWYPVLEPEEGQAIGETCKLTSSRTISTELIRF